MNNKQSTQIYQQPYSQKLFNYSKEIDIIIIYNSQSEWLYNASGLHFRHAALDRSQIKSA